MNRRAPLLRTIRVADWRRWQRAKGILAAVFVLGAAAAMGGLEWDPNTPDDANFGLAWLLLAAAGALCWSIEHKRR